MPPPKTFTASDGTVFEDREAYKKYEFELCYTFQGNRDKETLLVKPPDTINGQAFEIFDLQGKEVQLLDHSDQVTIDNVQDSR